MGTIRWFKHISKSRRDPDIHACRTQFGGDGVDIFWQTLEVLAEESKGEGQLSGPPSYFSDNFPGYSWRKIRKVWEFFGESSRKKRRIIFEEHDGIITVSVPKFREIASDYARRVSRNVRTNSEQTSDKVQTIEVEEEKDKNEKPKKRKSRPPVKAEIYMEIIAYLNELTGRNYKHHIPEVRQLIKARIHQGFSVDDFKLAVKNQCREWLGDEKMEPYLTPNTLFGPKMDKYVNNARIDRKKSVEELRKERSKLQH